MGPETRPIAPAGGGPRSAAEIALGPASTGEEIEFYCPNDHRLHGPASLQGQLGTCPACGAEFRIPSLEEWEEAVEEWQEPAEGTLPAPAGPPPPPLPPLAPSPPLAEPVAPDAAGPVSGEPPAPVKAPAGARAPASAPLPAASRLTDAEGSKGFAPVLPATASEGGVPATSLRQLLPTLWRYKDQGASIEIQHADGQRLHPDRFLADLSAGSHAVFADRAADGSYTLTAVAWHAILAVTVRGIQELAPEHGG